MPDNNASFSGLQPHGPRPPWTPFCPSGPAKGVWGGERNSQSSLGRTPPLQTTPNQHTVLVKTVSLLRQYNINTHCLQAPFSFQLVCQLEAPSTEILEHIHSLFIMCLLHSSLSLPFHSLDYLLNYHALSLQQTFPNLTLSFIFLPIQSMLLPD